MVVALTIGKEQHMAVVKELQFHPISENCLHIDFLEVNEMCRMDCFDVLGHLTYCLRYMKQRNGIEADISRFDDIIADSFRILAENGKGIEINTSGLRQGFGETFPNLKYVKLFRELGGEVLSIGSDSHTVEDIAKNFEDAADMAREVGFTRLCYFRERKPVFISID
jgi:histidinol-phosphatase (PHP family)